MGDVRRPDQLADWGVTFASPGASAGLNRAHITWLEYALIDRATATQGRGDRASVVADPAILRKLERRPVNADKLSDTAGPGSRLRG